METLSFKPQRQSTSAPGSRLLGRCRSISGRWRRRQKYTTLQQCRCQSQQDSSMERARHHPDEADSRLSRSTGIFHPSIWRDFFLGYSNPDNSFQQLQQAWMDRADKLKGEVAQMIVASSTTGDLHGRLLLVDVLERLCLDHLFEEEINAELAQIEAADVRDCDLGTVALWFYLLFTRRHLEMILPFVEGLLAREIQSTLEIPLPRRVRIYESKYYISTYEKDATLHDKVLQLAKLNSDIMQLHHQQELSILTRWWEDIKMESMIPFARDRIVECFLWILGVYFEPCHSRARIILTMIIAIVTLLDDIYDSYGSPEECDILTNCIERWDPKAAYDLPECMRIALGKILDSYEAIENMLHQEEKHRILYLRYFTEDLVRSFNMEVKMLQEGYIPESVEEHLKVSLRTGGCPILSCASFVGMHDIATTDFFNWVSSVPKMVQALSIILRLVDDLQSYEREQLIPHVALTIDSYMKEHNVSIEMAREKILILKEESWKDFNSEWLNPNNVYPKQLLERIFNLTRTMEFMYNQEDNFTNCTNLKDTIHSLFVEAYAKLI
ncbi:alpha-terpineol synthase, chloroplastic isoform X1 [Setaria viridis]|uniref:alpha-terpineol synthase, chloroplastic isoform X1 n=1 Tax=Setaria viridis TaxID=4556 RepID=UPI003B3B5376